MIKLFRPKRSGAALENEAGWGSTVGNAGAHRRDRILEKLVQHMEFDLSVLDVGCGYGDFFSFLQKRKITSKGVGIDVIPSDEVGACPYEYIQGNILDLELDRTFDLVFCSHTIEHVPDTERFLKKLFSFAKPNGLFCIIWPPPKKNIVGGHVHVFNMGLMLYNIVRLGIDCRNVEMYQAGYNLAIIGRYNTFNCPQLTFNRFELDALAEYFPCPVKHNFDGNLKRYVKRL